MSIASLKPSTIAGGSHAGHLLSRTRSRCSPLLPAVYTPAGTGSVHRVTSAVFYAHCQKSHEPERCVEYSGRNPSRKVLQRSFLGVGAPEAVLVGVVALVVFGPKGLAEVRAAVLDAFSIQCAPF